MNETKKDPPLVFISYSHDAAVHKAWVATLAGNLIGKGVDVILDVWNLHLGEDAARFMQDAVAEADRVLMICTERYVEKFDKGLGGAGYEGLVVTGELMENQRTTKFIPVLRQQGRLTLPKGFATRFYVNLSDGSDYDTEFDHLLRELHNVPLTPKPPLGVNPFAVSPQMPIKSQEPTTQGADSSDTLRYIDEEGLVRGLLRGDFTLRILEQIGQQDQGLLKESLLRLVEERAWSRMLANYLAQGLSHEPEFLISVAFDNARLWGVRCTVVEWLKFTAPSRRAQAVKLLEEHVDDYDMDNLRILVYGAGALANGPLIKDVVKKGDVLNEGYSNEKLGTYSIEAYLELYIKSPEEWKFSDMLSDLIRTFDETDKQAHMFLEPSHFYDRLRLMPRAKLAPLFRVLVPDRHNKILNALVWTLQVAPNPYLIDELMKVEGEYLRRDSLIAVAAIGKPESHRRLESIKDQPEARAAWCYSIGRNRVVAEVEELVSTVSDHSYRDLTYHYALWSLGELAAAGSEPALECLLTEKENKHDGHTRALAWLGLAKSGWSDAAELKDAAEIADDFVERVVLGIAGAITGDVEVLEIGLLAGTRNLATTSRLQANIYRDLTRALKDNWGEVGGDILRLLNSGN